jgi:hypothetical protein
MDGTLSTVHWWLNAAIAALASFAAFGSLNKMKWGTTKPCIVAAMLLIALGLAGQALGHVVDRWLIYADTALFGGMLALLLATQRVHSWFLERFANPVATLVAALTGIVFLLGMMSAAHGQENPIAQRCQAYAAFAHRLAHLRELEASLSLVTAEIRGMPPERQGGFTIEQLEREARWIWHQQFRRERAALDAHRRCVERLGDMGQEG